MQRKISTCNASYESLHRAPPFSHVFQSLDSKPERRDHTAAQHSLSLSLSHALARLLSDDAIPTAMPSPTTLTSLLLFIFLFLSLGFLLFYLLVKYKRRKTIPSLETEDSAPLFWTPTAAPPPPPLPRQDCGDETGAVMGGGEGEGEQQRRRKKRGKKKRQEPPGGGTEEAAGHGKQHHRKQQHDGNAEGCKSYPFSSFASATQRKIKLQYDQLVRSNQAKALTIEQVGQFINCLVEARNELQQKSEIIQRSFKIKKALLFKADRSSFDRLCQQIYKLEAEHKRLEEDAAVYNLLQEQLKLSPAYKTMLEISANMELKPELDQAAEFPDISFEELLAQEKKDVFWQRYTNHRSTVK